MLFAPTVMLPLTPAIREEYTLGPTLTSFRTVDESVLMRSTERFQPGCEFVQPPAIWRGPRHWMPKEPMGRSAYPGCEHSERRCARRGRSGSPRDRCTRFGDGWKRVDPAGCRCCFRPHWAADREQESSASG